MYDPIQVVAMIDHTKLKSTAATADFEKLCGEARVYGFKSVAINPRVGEALPGAAGGY